ncbi:MAG: ABC transporter permease [Spirochaetaceae bacterium]|jgi:putative ABC transport system permease protein|nr:ABC transporter permease [Spirochaetaceae bacterium]
MLEGILVEGLIYGIMALGVFITFRILDFPDLSVDGTFPMGAAIMASGITSGLPPMVALLIAFIGGYIAGMVTAIIHNRLKVPSLLAGILTMTMLWSVNIRILGNKANLPLLRVETMLSRYLDGWGSLLPREWSLLVYFLIVALLIKFLLDYFFKTDLGLTMGAMGQNEQMIIAQGINPRTLKILGVGLSNGLVATSGAFAAQYQGFADVNLGQGIVVTGLAMVMMGEFLLKSNKIGWLTLRVIIGAILYKAIMYFGRFYGYYINLTPNDLRLITGLLIIGALAFTKLKGSPKWKGKLSSTFKSFSKTGGTQ